MRSLDGKNPFLRSIWFIEADEDTPRVVMAYPLRRRAND